MTKIRQGSLPATNKTIFNLITCEGILDKQVLDIGAGGGYMAQLLGEHLLQNGIKPSTVITACDLFPEIFGYKEIECCKVEFFNEFPFPDQSFDIVYAIEVMEHLANPYEFIKETFRILKDGGKLIISVPNALNLNSRLSYLFTGFFSMFGPLSYDEKDAGRLSGHIMPLNYYYLDHRAKKVGFVKTQFVADKLKSSAKFLYLFFGPIIRLAAWWYLRKICKKDVKLYQSNLEALIQMNNRLLLCSRSCILTAEKPR